MLGVLYDKTALTLAVFSAGVPTFVYVSVASIVPNSVSGIVGGTDFKVRILGHIPKPSFGSLSVIRLARPSKPVV